MIRTTACPMCDNPNCYLVEFPNGTKRYRCDQCDCYYTPAWLMDENLAVLQGRNEESKGEMTKDRMIDREKVIAGLEFTKAMITFNPSTGEDTEPENLNEADKTTYDACVGAIVLLKEQETVVRCKDCVNCVKEPNGELYCDILAIGYEPLGSKRVTEDWFCADGAVKRE